MRFLIWSLVALVALGVVVLVIGWLLPAAREGRAEVVIAAPPAAVVAVIADVEAQGEWRDGIAAVERTAEGWVEVTARGERIAFVSEEMGEARVRLRFASDAGYSGRWEAVLLPEGAGTRVSVVERAVVPSPVGRILARLFFDPEAFATTYLAALKARVEGM